jgi:hypothetical protein
VIVAGNRSQSELQQHRFGKGPYIRVGCPPGAQFSKQLADTLQALQQGAVEKKWKVDWDQWKTLIASAETAVAEKDHSRSIREYGRAICFLMDQLRNQSEGSSSTIDL